MYVTVGQQLVETRNRKAVYWSWRGMDVLCDVLFCFSFNPNIPCIMSDFFYLLDSRNLATLTFERSF